MVDAKVSNKDKGLHFSKAGRDLILILIVVIVVLILSYFFDVFIIIVKFLQEHPRSIVYVDEIIMGLLTLSIGLTIFSWRRWVELKKEAAERIKKQEELIKMTETQAEVERVINKQLRSDMDIMKEDVQEIRKLLIEKLRS